MVGSGTTLVAARQLCRRAIGLDRDHLAVALARCACTSFDKARLERLQGSVLKHAVALTERKSFKIAKVHVGLPSEDIKFIRYWFPLRSQRELFALSEAIRTISNSGERDVAWVAFSSLIIAKSAGASYAMDIAVATTQAT